MKFFETTPKESPEMKQAKENLAGAESALRESIFRLGQTYYMAHKDDAAGEYADQVEMVRRQEENRRGFYQNVLRLEGKMMCENCGTIIPFGSAYCNSCGSRPDVRKTEETKAAGAQGETAATAEPAGVVCRNCGAVLDAGSAFCSACGSKVE